jgi:GntR family transcriptional regulator / MocR family aminotransferase
MTRRAKGALLPPLTRSGRLRAELYRTLRNALLDGRLAAGERLPSSRQTAAEYAVSRGVVEDVFDQLADEGFLERGVGRGTFVAPQIARLGTTAVEVISHPSCPSERGARLASNATCREPTEFRPFNAGVADAAEFPWKIWQRIHTRAARDLGRAGLNFADPRGLGALRTSLSHYLAQLRGMHCTEDQIVVFSSAQQALCAIALLLLNPGDSACLEDPGYPGANAALALAGARLVSLPVDRDGMRIDLLPLRAPEARLIYLTPAHQYPTGAVLSLERRIALLEWARGSNRWLLEDDYDGEFHYASHPLTPLYSLDSRSRVLYLGTLSKSMFVALRLAFAAVPPSLVEPLANIRTQLDTFTPPLPQLAMSRFMDEGHFSAHVRRMRGIYAEKCSQLLDAVAEMADVGWELPEKSTGLQTMLRHPDGTQVRKVAQSSGLALALLSSFRRARSRSDGLFLRFGALSLRQIQSGAAALLKAALVNR